MQKTEICSCRNGTGYAALYVGDEQQDVWVCNSCRFPTIEIWENNIEACWDCLSDFSAPPWQETCRRCTERLNASGEELGPYQGWLEAAKQVPSWRSKDAVIG